MSVSPLQFPSFFFFPYYPFSFSATAPALSRKSLCPLFLTMADSAFPSGVNSPTPPTLRGIITFYLCSRPLTCEAF